MGATSLALSRRQRDPRYAERWFVGRGLDIGAGGDSLALQNWPRAHVEDFDKAQGDAQLLAGLVDISYDFLYSSHCLEHLHQPIAALQRWWDVLRPNGYLILVVPDFLLYERGIWPSRIHGAEHRTFWTTWGLLRVLEQMGGWELCSLNLLDDGFDATLSPSVDQTLPPYNAECGIEVIARKR